MVSFVFWVFRVVFQNKVPWTWKSELQSCLVDCRSFSSICFDVYASNIVVIFNNSSTFCITCYMMKLNRESIFINWLVVSYSIYQQNTSLPVVDVDQAWFISQQHKISTLNQWHFHWNINIDLSLIQCLHAVRVAFRIIYALNCAPFRRAFKFWFKNVRIGNCHP